MNTTTVSVTPELYINLARDAGWNATAKQMEADSSQWTFSTEIKAGSEVIMPTFTIAAGTDNLHSELEEFIAQFDAEKNVRDILIAKHGSLDAVPVGLSDMGRAVDTLDDGVQCLLAALDCPQLEADLADWLADTHYRDALPDSPGMYEDELFADYRDKLSSAQMKDILESGNPGDSFYDILTEMYEESRRYEEDCLEEEAVKAMEEKRGGEALGDIRAEALRSFLRDHFYFNVPANHFLKQEFPVTIVLDTGDGDFDFVLNTRYPHYSGNDEPMDERASLVWLARQQGYSKETLEAALDKGDMRDPQSFLETCRVELANAGSSMLATVFLVRMTVEQILLLNALDKLGTTHLQAEGTQMDLGHIVLGQNTTTGLFDLWSGAGGPLEITLEKDVVLPINIIRSAWPDGMDGRYSARDVYGLCESAFTDSLKEIQLPDGLRERGRELIP